MSGVCSLVPIWWRDAPRDVIKLARVEPYKVEVQGTTFGRCCECRTLYVRSWELEGCWQPKQHDPWGSGHCMGILIPLEAAEDALAQSIYRLGGYPAICEWMASLGGNPGEQAR